jgi:hypothetical protein
MNDLGTQQIVSNKKNPPEVLNLDPKNFDENDVSVKVSANALKNFHILSVIFTSISAGFFVVDLTAMVVVILTAYVFSVLSATVAMNVLIILGILAVVLLVGIICGAIVNSAAKRKMIKDTPKPNPSKDANQDEKNPVNKPKPSKDANQDEKNPVNKPNPSKDANQDEKKLVKIVGCVNVLKIGSNKLEEAKVVFKNSTQYIDIMLGINILELKVNEDTLGRIKFSKKTIKNICFKESHHSLDENINYYEKTAFYVSSLKGFFSFEKLKYEDVGDKLMQCIFEKALLSEVDGRVVVSAYDESHLGFYRAGMRTTSKEINEILKKCILDKNELKKRRVERKKARRDVFNPEEMFLLKESILKWTEKIIKNPILEETKIAINKNEFLKILDKK